MEFGLVFHRLVPGTFAARKTTDWLQDAERLLKVADRAGFKFMAFSNAWQDAPTPQPVPTIARLAAVPTNLRFATEILLLPMLNPVDVAYNFATLDRILDGRLDFGVGLGYHPREVEAGGITRSDRRPRLEEALEVIKRVWSGEEVHHRGRYFSLSGLRMQTLPVQKPHPPVLMSSYSHGSAARAARLADGIVVGQQTGFTEVKELVATFKETWQQTRPEPPTRVGAWRTLLPGRDPHDALERARGAGVTFTRYQRGRMQESTAVRLRLELDENASEWAMLGNYQDCAERIAWCRDEAGLTRITLDYYPLTDDLGEVVEYLQGFGDEVIPRFA